MFKFLKKCFFADLSNMVRVFRRTMYFLRRACEPCFFHNLYNLFFLFINFRILSVSHGRRHLKGRDLGIHLSIISKKWFCQFSRDIYNYYYLHRARMVSLATTQLLPTQYRLHSFSGGYKGKEEEALRSHRSSENK